MKKVIRFFNRTYQQVRESFFNLKERYKIVSWKWNTVKMGFYSGHFSVA